MSEAHAKGQTFLVETARRGNKSVDTFRTVYRILRRLEQMMDLEEPSYDWISAKSLGLTESKLVGILEMLMDEKHIAGVSIKRSGDGSIVEVSMTNPRITLRGSTYLYTDPMMLKAAELASGTTEYKQS